MDCVDGDKCGGLGAESVVAECHGAEAGVKSALHFHRVEVALRADKHRSAACLRSIGPYQRHPLDIVVAIAYEPAVGSLCRDKLADGVSGPITGSVAFSDCFMADTAIRSRRSVFITLRSEWRQSSGTILLTPDFNYLLDKPLHPVGIFSRGYSQGDIGVPYRRLMLGRDDFDIGVARIV